MCMKIVRLTRGWFIFPFLPLVVWSDCRIEAWTAIGRFFLAPRNVVIWLKPSTRCSKGLPKDFGSEMERLGPPTKKTSYRFDAEFEIGAHASVFQIYIFGFKKSPNWYILNDFECLDEKIELWNKKSCPNRIVWDRKLGQFCPPLPSVRKPPPSLLRRSWGWFLTSGKWSTEKS